MCPKDFGITLKKETLIKKEPCYICCCCCTGAAVACWRCSWLGQGMLLLHKEENTQ
jgi:hypothetical protein